MVGFVALHLYAVAAGMTAAGLAASLHSLLVGRPASHVPWEGPVPMRLAWAGFAVVAGPFILARHSLRRAGVGSALPVILGAVLALGWSLMSGVVLIETAFALTD